MASNDSVPVPPLSDAAVHFIEKVRQRRASTMPVEAYWLASGWISTATKPERLASMTEAQLRLELAEIHAIIRAAGGMS